MGKKLFSVLLLLAGPSALAGFTTCSTSGFYYDSMEIDRGFKPGLGDQLGSETLLIDNKIVQSFPLFFQQKPAPEYFVNFGDDKKILEVSGSSGDGSTTYSVTMIITKRDHSDITPGQKSLSPKVVCTQLYRQVP